MRKIKDTKDIKRAAAEIKSVAACAFIQLFSLSSVVGGSVRTAVVFSGVVVSGAEVCSVSVGSGCVAAGAVAEDSGVMVVLSFGVLLGVVGAVGAVGVVGAVGSADGSVVTPLSGVWVVFCCEPMAVINSPL